jgi:putative MATE family efflux protein
MKQDFTTGNISAGLIRFSLPLIFSNLFQQLYNLADTFMVGRFIGQDALAAVGASYTLMTFLTSILLGLCMGSSAYFAIQYGGRDMDRLKNGVFQSFFLIAAWTVLLNAVVYIAIDPIIRLIRTPLELTELMKEYLLWVFAGITATFFYNFFANLLRAVGESVTPLIFLGISVLLNIVLDYLLIVPLSLGVAGAAAATVIAQYIAGVGIAVYTYRAYPALRPEKQHRRWEMRSLKNIFTLSFFTCLQQSVMNFGILMVQGLVNRFGTVVMAAFAVAVKIDTIAYMPVQDFGNAFSTFIAQNYGAGKNDRIRRGILSAGGCVTVFCLVISLLVCLFAPQLMGLFLEPGSTSVIEVGGGYLRIEAAFYLGIGVLFLLYGYFRAVNRPAISVVLTVCSLGTRVGLAYLLSGMERWGVTGIWLSIPIGWLLADAVGIALLFQTKRKKASCICSGV